VRPAGWRLRRPDVVLSAIAALGVLLVHDLAYVLHHPYWLDEAWVVDSTRVRLSDLTHASAITPLGFTVLLRGAVLGGDQRQRLVPLAFAGATVSAAYLCGRQVGLPRSVSFLLLALPVLFVPALLVRDDLKQYTAEALWSVLVLLLMLRLESVWSRRRLGALTLAVGVGPLFANAALFVGSAGLLALGVTSLCRRRWGRLREVVLAGVCALLVVGPLLVLLVLPQQNAALKHYWDSYYLPTDPASAWSFLVGHLQAFAPTTGLPNVVVVLLGCTTGIAMLVRRGRSASALLVPLAFAELVLAGALHVYPLLDLRTSTWLAVLAAVLIGLGVGEVLQSLAGRFQQAAVGLAADDLATAATAATTAATSAGRAAAVRSLSPRGTTLGVDYPCEVEVVLVNDGSVDATASIVAGITDPRLQVITHQVNQGKGAAISTAAREASGDYLIVCDADLEYSPEEIPLLLRPVINGEAEVVYGTRTFGSHTAYSFWYVLGNKAVTMFANVVYDCWLSDLETCYKLMPTDLYRRLGVTSAGFGMEAEITAKLLRCGYRPHEVPISYKARSREQGKKLTWKDGVEALWILTRVRLTNKKLLAVAGQPS